jgi:hypothetical protein
MPDVSDWTGPVGEKIRRFGRKLFHPRRVAGTRHTKRPLIQYLAAGALLLAALAGGIYFTTGHAASCRAVEAMSDRRDAVFPRDPVGIGDSVSTRNRLRDITSTDYARWAENMRDLSDQVRDPRMKSSAYQVAYLSDKMVRLRELTNPEAPGSSPRLAQNAAKELEESKTVLYRSLDEMRAICT